MAKETWLIAMWDIHKWVDIHTCPKKKLECDLESNSKAHAIIDYISEKAWNIIVQLWDLWVNKDAISYFLNQVSPINFKVLWWNRDHYETLIDSPHYLWDYWTTEIAWRKISFLRWAKTQNPNRKYICKYEELSDQQQWEAFKYFWREENLWEIMFSHVPPICISRKVYKQDMRWDRTEHFLWEIFNMYKPKYWIFGHYHELFFEEVDWTKFICLWEMDTLSLDEETLSKINSLDDLKKEVEKIKLWN